MVSAQLELQLPTSEEAPEIARRRVVERFGAELDPRQMADARLLTSELVTNAVVHGRGKIGLSALLDEDRLVIEVTDEGAGFERTVRQHGSDAVGGNGLNIVDTLATRWGIHADSSHVWFELERPGPRLGPKPNPTATPAPGRTTGIL
jgi:anti-sigma regulatory factor (Ser/Thr protein kinase)